MDSPGGANGTQGSLGNGSAQPSPSMSPSPMLPRRRLSVGEGSAAAPGTPPDASPPNASVSRRVSIAEYRRQRGAERAARGHARTPSNVHSGTAAATTTQPDLHTLQKLCRAGVAFCDGLRRTPPIILLAVAYTLLVLGLLTYLWSVWARGTLVNTELTDVAAGHPSMREFEKVEIAKLLEQRVYEDYLHVLAAAERALAARGGNGSGGGGGDAAVFAYDSLLPEVYAGLAVLGGLTREARGSPRHDVLRSLAARNPTGVGSASWQFQRGAQIRGVLGPPLSQRGSTPATAANPHDVSPAEDAASGAPELHPARGAEGAGGVGGDGGDGRGHMGVIWRCLLLAVLISVLLLRDIRHARASSDEDA